MWAYFSKKNGNINIWLNFIIFLVFFNAYLFLRERERERKQGRDRERGTHRIQSRLQALSCQHRPDTGLKLMSYEIMI